MACFLVSAAEAAVVTVLEKREEKKEALVHETSGHDLPEEEVSIPMSRKLKWLSYMLWGGAVLLMFEHIWHGEVVPWFPFLTAMTTQASTVEMLHEMATTGVCMAVLVTVIWGIMCKAADAIVKRSAEKETAESAL